MTAATDDNVKTGVVVREARVEEVPLVRGPNKFVDDGSLQLSPENAAWDEANRHKEQTRVKYALMKVQPIWTKRPIECSACKQEFMGTGLNGKDCRCDKCINELCEANERSGGTGCFSGPMPV